MTQSDATTVRLKVSPEIARIVQPGAPRDVQLAAARGALPLAGKDFLSVLFFLCRGSDQEIRQAAIKTLREMPVTIMAQVLKDSSLHPQLIDLLVKARLSDGELMGAVIVHPGTAFKTHLYIAQKAPGDILERLAGYQDLLYRYPDLVDAIIANPAAEKALKFRLGWQDPELAVQRTADPETFPDDENADEDNGHAQPESDALLEEDENEGLSKYQIALDLSVSEKIKMGLTGDKEWRSIMMKESNKLIQGAVMKNPRISDGEVLLVAKNKTSSDDLIRLILLNKDWLKNYEIKKALVVHPKTPPPKALRFISYLTLKDLKDLARSRQISNIVATAARKELEHRIKKSGG